MILFKPFDADDEKETDSLAHNTDSADELEQKLTYCDVL